MPATDAPPHRFRFGLRTLFVLVVIVAIPCAWVTYSLNWIRQRHVVLGDSSIVVNKHFTLDAPGGLWLFGEFGLVWLKVRPTPAREHERIQQLFPEARIDVEEPYEWPIEFLDTTRNSSDRFRILLLPPTND